jgi:hypothetical protein
MGGIRDGARDIDPVPLLAPQSALAADTDSASVDTVDGGSATLLVQVGAVAGAGSTFILEESDDNAAWNALVDPSLDQIGDAIPTPLLANTIYKVGYVGNKRYVRVALTLPNATDVGVSIVKGHLDRTPVEDKV